jgi:uncharacterized repeat protein (TIGR01451 family)
MKMARLFPSIAFATALVAVSPFSFAQSTSVKLFGPVNVRLSTDGSGYGDSQVTYNSTTLNLSCPANVPIQAKISSTQDGTGNLLEDNFINLTVIQGTSAGPTQNICTGGVFAVGQQNCFSIDYQHAAGDGNLTGQNPDTFVSTDGIAPIDIGGFLSPGMIQAKIDLVDAGGYIASSTLYLQTNCAFLGVSGPGEVTGNPIPANNPTTDQLTQVFPFNLNTDLLVQFSYDLSEAKNAGQLNITDSTIPSTGDLPLTPAQYQSYVSGTSFASSNCMIHSGELLNGQAVCKLYTLACTVGTGANQSGANCPVSQLPNEIFQESFDGPPFTLPDIAPAVPGGPTFHQGVGFLMASEGWNGPNCTFDPASGLQNLLCPQNLLTGFSGPGTYASTGRGTHPNSSFITVAPVPEDLTTVSIVGVHPGGWINTSTLSFNIASLPPSLPGVSAFVAAPIKSISYGISTPATLPTPGPPITSDTILPNVACPTPTNPLPAAPFTPSQVQTIPGLADGNYLLHYFAEDCAGTLELKFVQDGSGTWSTALYTIPVNVDTIAPTFATGPTLSPAPSTNGGVANSYVQYQPVMASYSCSDTFSGVVRCGTSTFAPGTMTTPVVTSTVDTSTTGSKTFTVTAIDAAGNQTTSSVPYRVVASAPVDLGIVKLATASVKRFDPITYSIVVANSGKNTANSVVVSDPLPAGVTYVSASAQIITCTWKGCSSSTQGTGCSAAGNVVTCTTGTLTPLSLSSISGIYIQIVGTATAPSGTVLKNTATVSSANPDSHPGDNTSSASTKVK